MLVNQLHREWLSNKEEEASLLEVSVNGPDRGGIRCPVPFGEGDRDGDWIGEELKPNPHPDREAVDALRREEELLVLDPPISSCSSRWPATTRPFLMKTDR